jgi:succinate dehydrogenase hydrophobic anchor subunit
MAEQKRVATSKVAGTWAWFFQRFSAVALIVLLCIHLYISHFSGVGEETGEEPLITFGEVSVRLDQLSYIVVDYLLLAMVLFHGLNGTRTVLFDFDRFAKHRKAVDITLFVVGVATLIWGIVILFPFITAGG